MSLEGYAALTSAITNTVIGNSSKTNSNQVVTGRNTQTGKSNTNSSKTGTESTGLEIDDEGVEKIISDILSGTGGLADIFSAQGAAGAYDATAAAAASGDLVAKVTGEIAKLKAKQVTTFDVHEDSENNQTQTTESDQETNTRSKTKGGLVGLFS